MRKIIASLFAALLSVALLGVDSRAAAPEPERPCSLTLYYTQDGKVFSGLEVSVYRVAALHADGTYTRVSPYDTYPIAIDGITSQQEWRVLASGASGTQLML